MTGQNIIDRFELQVDDLTEMSSTEELAILNRVYKRVCSQMPWEFLKKQDSGSISQDSDGYYITKPSDFLYFSENGNYTDNSTEWQGNSASRVIFVGSSYTPIKIVNFSDRRQYRDSAGYAYLDLVNDQIRFTADPQESTYEFDYIYLPDDLTTATSPVFPSNFHDFLAYGMAVENDILQLSEKARSYVGENTIKFEEDLANMKYWNSNQRHE